MKPQPRYKPGDRIGGRYQVHKALMGGMGEVYQCLDLEQMLPLALKTFQQRYFTDSQRQWRIFEQEVATWVALEQHPNIVRCHMMRIFNNQPFIVLEWIAGEAGHSADLRSWLRRGPVDLKVALDTAIDVCRGLIHAQTKRPGLVHCDLKPENILIAQGRLAKITDFGLAQVLQEVGVTTMQEDDMMDSPKSLANNRPISGTPAYMAPEQWLGEALDERTDIYALGCVLHELLTGTTPFTVDYPPTTREQKTGYLQAMQAAHVSEPYLGSSADIPILLDELLHSCLAKTLNKRPTSLVDLLHQLAKIYQQQFEQSPPTQPALNAFTAIDYNNRGITFADLQQYEKALDDYERALTLDPNDATVYYNRGNAYVSLKQHEQAIADYTRAVELNASFFQAYANRGAVYELLRKFSASLADYRRVIEIDSNNAYAYLRRGAIYEALQEYEQALNDYKHVVDLDPDNTAVYYAQGNCHAALNRHEQAIEDFSNAINLNQSLAQAYYNRGNSYVALNRHEQAIEDFTMAIQLNPQHVNAYFNRGNRFRVKNRFEAAIDDYSSVIKLNPKDVEAYSIRASLYEQVGIVDKAVSDLQCVVKLIPDDIDVNFRLGVLLVNDSQFQNALTYLDLAASRGHPTAPDVVNAVRRILGLPLHPEFTNPSQYAFNEIQKVKSFEDMKLLAKRCPIILNSEFIKLVENAARLFPKNFSLCLTWLHMLVAQQNI